MAGGWGAGDTRLYTNGGYFSVLHGPVEWVSAFQTPESLGYTSSRTVHPTVGFPKATVGPKLAVLDGEYETRSVDFFSPAPKTGPGDKML